MEFKSVIKPFKNIWQVAAVMIIFNMVFLHFFWPNSYNSVQSFLISNFWGSIIWITQAVGNSAVFHFLDEKLPWRNGMLKRALANIAGIGLYSTVAYLVVQFIMYSIFVPEVSWSDMWSQSIQSTKLTLTISFSISFILTFIGFGKSMIAMEVEKEKLQTEMVQHKYNSLRSQINPHFLFNSFNVLTELVYEDQKLAEKFIHQLSDLYRYVLDVKDVEIIELHEEIKFIESFTFLLKTRFENRVSFSMDISTNDDDFIIPMSLQILIENCIKHNQATTQKPLEITIRKLGDRIEVKNNLQLKLSPIKSHHIGLENLKERYAYFTKEHVIIDSDPSYFSVSIPILTSKLQG